MIQSGSEAYEAYKASAHVVDSSLSFHGSGPNRRLAGLALQESGPRYFQANQWNGSGNEVTFTDTTSRVTRDEADPRVWYVDSVHTDSSYVRSNGAMQMIGSRVSYSTRARLVFDQQLGRITEGIISIDTVPFAGEGMLGSSESGAVQVYFSADYTGPGLQREEGPDGSVYVRPRSTFISDIPQQELDKLCASSGIIDRIAYTLHPGFGKMIDDGARLMPDHQLLLMSASL